MTFQQAYDTVQQMNFDDDLRCPAFHSAVIIIYCCSVGCWNISKTHKAAQTLSLTGDVFTKREIRDIVFRLHDAEIISYGQDGLNATFAEDDLQNMIEFSLLAMVGSGEVMCR